MKPLVSIIIPTHNRVEYVSKAINSALNQSYKKIEVIVIDDFSSDNTKEVVLNMKDKRIKYFRNEKNLGGPKSRNKGLKLSKGYYINFLDDDDELLPNKIKLQLEKFSKSKVKNLGVVTCDVEYRRSDMSKIKKNRKKGNIYVDLLKSYCVYATHSMSIKKSAFDKVLFDPQLQSNQEYDLIIALSKNNSFDYIPKLLCRIYTSKNQISFNFDKKLNGTIIF